MPKAALKGSSSPSVQSAKNSPSNSRGSKNKKEEEVGVIGRIFDFMGTIYGIMRKIAIFFLFLLFVVYMFYGGGTRFPVNPIANHTALLSSQDLQIVAQLHRPPGNIAVASGGTVDRVFFSFHPEGYNDKKSGSNIARFDDKHEGSENDPVTLAKVVELDQATGQLKPFPSLEAQSLFNTVLSLRIEERKQSKQTWLWTLDYADHVLFGGTPRLLAFDIDSREIVHDYSFDRNIAGFGSMLNDFAIDSTRGKIYIADASIFRKAPAIIIYDIATKTAKRVLESHHSVKAKPYNTFIESANVEILLLGVFAVRPNVDSIALDNEAEYLYYSAVTDPVLHRIKVDGLLSSEPPAFVEGFVNKTMSDGIVVDFDGNILITDMEHSAIVRVNTETKSLDLVARDNKLLRWPDGLHLGSASSNEVYLTCSSLENVILKTTSHIEASAPYHIFKFKIPPPKISI